MSFPRLVALLLALSLPQAHAANLTVFAASSLNDAFSEIGKAFGAATGHRTTFQFAGSPTLRTQLEQGARADVYASASAAQYEPLVEAGLLGAGQIFTRNRLLIVAPKGNLAVRTLADLGKPGVKLVLADAAVPVGEATRRTLNLIGASGTYGPAFGARVLANVVSEEPNVRQVAVKIGLGQGDAAVIYASDLTPSLRPAVRVIKLPERFNPLTSYPVGVLNGSANASAAREFVAYLLSAQGQRLLKKWGFVGVK